MTEELHSPGTKTELNACTIQVKPFSYPRQNILGNAMHIAV